MTTPERPPGLEAWVRFLTAPWRTYLDPASHPLYNLTENRMAAFSDALADLDEQIDALEAYVLSDETTDAAEVQARVSRIKAALASAQPAEEPPAGPTA